MLKFNVFFGLYRYADIIVHRLLASCIGADSTYANLLDKRKTSLLCNNLNYRNRMAQYAGRASVSLNTHLFFRGRTQEENGYILFVRKNALQILIPKFGLEGTIYLSGKKGATHKSGIQFVFDEEVQLVNLLKIACKLIIFCCYCSIGSHSTLQRHCIPCL